MTERLQNNGSSIFVPTHREQEYCRDNGIELRRLPNGITILGMSRGVSDRAHATVRFNLASGAYFDPPGKSGLHHFMEHIVVTETSHIANSLGVSLNASTSAEAVQIHFEDAVANPAVPAYGLWQMLPLVRQLFNNPFQFTDDMDRAIEIERNVILAELDQVTFGTAVRNAHMTFLFDESHPARNTVIGTQEDIRSITSADVYKIAQPLFHPDGLTITVFTEGEKDNGREVVDVIAGLFGNYSGDPHNHRPHIDPALYDRFNPNFRGGKVYQARGRLGTGRAEVSFIWKVPFEWCSGKHGTIAELVNFLDKKLLQFYRQNGLGYFSRAQVKYMHTSALVNIDMSLPPQLIEDTSSITGTLRSQLIGKVIASDNEALTHYRGQRRLAQSAEPVSLSNQFDLLTETYQMYGRILDLGKANQNFENVTVEDMERLQQTLLAQSPAIIIVS